MDDGIKERNGERLPCVDRGRRHRRRFILHFFFLEKRRRFSPWSFARVGRPSTPTKSPSYSQLKSQERMPKKTKKKSQERRCWDVTMGRKYDYGLHSGNAATRPAGRSEAAFVDHTYRLEQMGKWARVSINSTPSIPIIILFNCFT